MKKLLLRASSLTFAVVVTGILVARAAGCTSGPAVERVAPLPSPPATMPSDPAQPAVDAGPTLGVVGPGNADFLPATKAAMPIFHEPAPQQQATPR